MIAARFLLGWNVLVESAALIAIVVLAIGVMVGAMKIGENLRHLGAVLGITILLTMVPAIILGLWSAMSLGQHLGIILICAAIATSIVKSRKKPEKR